MTWFGKGFAIFKSAPGQWIVALIILVVLALLGALLNMIPFVGMFVTNLGMPVLLGGLMLGCQAADQGDGFKIDHLFAGFKAHFGPLVLVGLLYLAGIFMLAILFGIVAVIGGVGIAAASSFSAIEQSWPIFLAVLLVLMLAFIPLAMAFYFAPTLVVTQNLGPFDAMVQSFKGCLKNVLPFFVYFLVAGLLSLIAAIPLGLGFLVLGPMLFGATYASYKSIYLH
ncbi:BPSS1780 family membrane protein [Andreprevotia sp. IGB-42]|uniref:BPSS1780 family membrane protein n=1 Tax=Andreprevotia sp. IGB-42 TaxID=2497473 RepID=UPI00135C6528|nr:BPSS1780 family membrane protein [Andreprevotia sp. IGB-42]